jgi:hypothetical protein
MENVMKKFLAITAAVAVMSIALVAPVDAQGAVQGDGVVLNLVPAPGQSPPVTGATVVHGATASIHRNAAGVTINIHTVGLDAGHAYTVWVFEVSCEPSCGPIQLAGHVVGGSGAGDFSGRLGINSDPALPVQDPLGGDFHVIIADHGLLDPANMPHAIKSGIPPFTGTTQNWEQLIIFAP